MGPIGRMGPDQGQTNLGEISEYSPLLLALKRGKELKFAQAHSVT